MPEPFKFEPPHVGSYNEKKYSVLSFQPPPSQDGRWRTGLMRCTHRIRPAEVWHGFTPLPAAAVHVSHHQYLSLSGNENSFVVGTKRSSTT